MRRISTVLLICSLLLAAAASWLLWRMASAPPPQSAALGGPFRLVDQDGRQRSDADFHGRYVLLYFGYTFCPDVCPTTLAMMANALAKLGAEQDGIVPVFVTVDPERDTPAVLKAYLANFGPRFVGLTGKPGQIAAVAHAYRVYYAKHPLPGGGYSVDHSSVIYLLDPKGRFVKFYDDGVSAAALAADLKTRL